MGNQTSQLEVAIDESKIDEIRLQKALEEGRVNDVKALLDEGFDIHFEFQDKFGVTPLHIAAEYGHKDVIDLLISNGAYINQTNKFGWTPLYRAAENGHKDVVALLIANGANVNQADRRGWAPLYIAAKHDYKDVMVLLIANGANVNQARKYGKAPWYGRTPVYFAAKNGHEDVVALLISNGAHLNRPNKDGCTPLYSAADNGHKDVVTLLIANGANVNQTNNDGWTPLYNAAHNGQKDVVALLISNGANINQPNKDGETPLYTASFNGHTEVISLLLQANADLHTQTNEGLTALMIAEQNNHKDIVDLLTKAKENAEMIDAVKSGDASQLELLLPKLKNPNIINEDGNSLFHLAIETNKPLVLAKLLQLPTIQLDLCNRKKETPFILAMKLRYHQMIKIIDVAINKPMQHIDIKDLKYDSNDFLAEGSFGAVYKGTYKNELVAIKKMKFLKQKEKSDEFEREINAMLHCRSPFLLHLLGVVDLNTNEPKIVLQFMDGGDLRNHLDKLRNNEPTVTNYSTLEIIWAIANSLADIHHNNSTKHYIKLADLGSTRSVANTMTQGVGTLYWIAPEVFQEVGHYGAAADMYSFGVVLTELETLALPYSDKPKLSDLAFMNGVCDGSLRPALSTKCAPWYKKLVEECLDNDPNKRPTAPDVIMIIETLIVCHSDIHLSVDPSSETMPTSSSLSSTAMSPLSPLPQIATMVNCRSCQESNSIVNEACSKCNAPLLQAAVKVNILIQRFKNINIDASYFCSSCGNETAIKADHCHQCHATLSNADKVNQLVARSAMRQAPSPP